MKLVIFGILATIGLISFVESCNNFTGTCTENNFVCANEETVPHIKRCDGIEDCADGTDEYMCHAPKIYSTIHVRNALVEVSCVKCTCKKGSITIENTNTQWFKTALVSPRDLTMLTKAPAQQNKPCNPLGTTSIILNVYKKQNKGCRGYVCCFRQEMCSVCTIGTSGTNCY